jgi:uncharacterized membrane protein YhaH (DUF805 family)
LTKKFTTIRIGTVVIKQSVSSIVDLRQLFSFKGRVGRAEFWLTYLGLAVAAFVTAFVALIGVGLLSEDLAVVQAVVSAGLAVIVWISLALNARRLHDLGHSAWWQLKWVGILFVALLVVAVLTELTRSLVFFALLGSIVVGIDAWTLIKLGFYKGEPHANAYGIPNSGSIRKAARCIDNATNPSAQSI